MHVQTASYKQAVKLKSNNILKRNLTNLKEKI